MTITNYKLYAIKPKATTNLCTNPSFETGTTGWTTGGTNTIAKSTEQQRRGVYSCKSTYQDNDLLASYAITLTDTDHVGALDIYIPSTYTGTQLTLTWTGYTSGVIISGLADMTIVDKWQRVHCHINPASGDLAGTFTLSETGTNGSAAEFIYIDGVQIETGTAPTTYIDGDIEGNILADDVLEYYWNGQQHASTSVRTANTRAGGELVDISAYCKNILLEGLGVSPVDNVSVPQTNGGEVYLYSNYQSRYFTLQAVFEGSHIGDIQTKRKALWDLIKPDVNAYPQPLVLRYQAYDANGSLASDPVDIKCQYVSGLDRSPQMRFAHFADITFRVSDTALEIDGDNGTSLDYNDTLANANYIVKRDRDGVWSAIGLGANGTIQDIKYFNGDYYVAGDFTSFNGTAVNRICKIDLAGNVTVLGNGFNNTVYSIGVGADGTIYVVGAFTASGATPISYTAYFDGANWQELGGGTNGETFDIKVNNNGDIYCTCWGGSLGVAKLTAGTWVEIGNLSLSRRIDFTSDGDIFVTNSNGVNKYNTITSSFDIIIGDVNGRAALKIINDNIYSGSNYIAGKYTGILYKHNLKTYTKLKSWAVTGSVSPSGFTRIRQFDNVIYAVGTFYNVDGYTISDGIITIVNDNFIPIDINFPGTASINVVEQDDKKNLLFGFSTSGSAETAGDDTITNGGTAVTYPVITITGPGLLRQIVNTTTGKGIYFNNLTLQAGEVITLDLRPDKLTMESTFRGNIKGYVVKGSNLDFPLIPGNNRIATFIDGTTTSATSATMRWKEMIHSIDGAQYE